MADFTLFLHFETMILVFHTSRFEFPLTHGRANFVILEVRDFPCFCGRGCLLAPSTVRTPPAGAFPLVSANVSSRMVVSNYYEHFSSSPRGLAIGADAECLELSIMEQLETNPVPLGTSHISSHIAPRRCGGLRFKRPCVSRRDTPHERACARDEHHSSPVMSTAHTFHARDGARDRERAGFRVSGLCRRRVVGGVFGSSTEEANGGSHRGGK